MTQISTIRVASVDDHDLLRNGLRLALETIEDVELVGEASRGADVLDLCMRVYPDVVLMDLMMPEMDGVAAIRELRRMVPNIRVIALTSFVDDALVHAALAAGAVSYLMKNVSVGELTAAIRRAYAGESTLSTEATQALVNAASTPPPSQYFLTVREKQVLTMMADGHSNAEISCALRVEISTVKKHVSSILEKMRTTSRTEAVIVAIKHKLVDISTK